MNTSSEPVVIFENADFVVLNKPSGLQVHPARVALTRHRQERNEPMLTEWIVKHFPETKTVGDDPATRPGIVHRLDKETSGVMIVPRTQDFFERMKKLFQEHAVQKEYRAIVEGVLENTSGVIDAPIGIKNGTLKRSIHATKMVKPAVTEYAVLQEGPAHDGKSYSLLSVMPKTGRTHQIRVHLRSIGHPIAGDTMYGSKKQPSFVKRLMLHAHTISFSLGTHQFVFEAPLPEEFTSFIKISTAAE